MFVAAQRLIEYRCAGTLVQVVAELTTYHIVGAYCCHLVAVELIAVGEAYLRAVVACEGASTVDRLRSHHTTVEGVHHLCTVSQPAADGATLTLAHDVAGVVAVDDAHISLAEVVHTEDTSTVSARGTDVHRSLVAAVLNGEHGLADCCTSDTCRVAGGVDLARLVDNDIFNRCTADNTEETLVATFRLDDHVQDTMAVTIEDAHVRTLHVLPVALAILLAETSTNTLETNALHVDIGSQVDDYVACHFTIVHSIGESLQLFAIADEACTAHLADVVLILVIGTLGLAFGVGVADVATSRAVTVHRTNGIDHQVIGKRYGIVVATQCLTPSIAGTTLVEAVAELA